MCYLFYFAVIDSHNYYSEFAITFRRHYQDARQNGGVLVQSVRALRHLLENEPLPK